MLHFFGSIDAEHTSHEIRGLNVIVRLAKSSVDWAWPQLTAENVKMHWLSYDYNAIKTDDIYLDKGESGKFAARNWFSAFILIKYFDMFFSQLKVTLKGSLKISTLTILYLIQMNLRIEEGSVHIGERWLFVSKH